MAGDKNYLELLDKMKDLHIKKNAGYSGDSPDRWANFRESEEFGVTSILGVLVRMSDKWIRIKNLIKNPNNEQVGEAITDTLMDLASYSLIAICLINESVRNPTSTNLTPQEGKYYIVIVRSAPDQVAWYWEKIGSVYRAKYQSGRYISEEQGGWLEPEDVEILYNA